MTDPAAILVVHPDASTRAVLARQVRAEGLETVTCGDAAAARELLARRRFAAVVVDSSLPRAEQDRIASAAAAPVLRAELNGAEGSGAGLAAALAQAVGRLAEGARRDREARREAVAVAKELLEANRRLAETDRKKNSCLAVATHELRTPLTMVTGYLKLLLGESLGSLNQKQRHLLEESRRHVERLTELVNSMLDRCRIEAGAADLELQEISYVECLRGVAARMREFVEENGHTLRLDLPAEDLRLAADPGAVEQILLNLIGNAVKFTPAAGTITVSCRAEEGGVVTRVQDTGVGIEPHELDKVFEEFNRVGKRHGDKKGAGLGLSICKRLVQAHHGEIWVESSPGRGSTFCFRLPQGVAQPAQP